MMYWFVFCVTVVVHLIYGEYLDFLVKVVFGMMLPILLMFTYLVRIEKWAKIMMFVNTSIFFVLLVGINFSVVEHVNLFFFLLVPIVASYYHHWVNILYAMIISCVGFVFFLNMHGQELLGEKFVSSTSLLYIGLFVIFGFVSVSQAHASERLYTIAENNASEAKKQEQEAIEFSKSLEKTIQSIYGFSNRLSDTMVNVNHSSDSLKTGVNEMTESFKEQLDAINSVSESTEYVKHNVYDINDAAMDMKNKNNETKEHITQTEYKVTNLNGVLLELKDTFDQSLFTSDQLYEKTKEIGEIIRTIDNISKQTHLLSLNASIEAARVGEQGKGFQVVANEVKKLAESSSLSTKNVENILREIRVYTLENKEKLDASKSSFDKTDQNYGEIAAEFQTILQKNNETTIHINNIALKIEKLKEAIVSINQHVLSVSSASEENSGSLDEIRYAFESLHKKFDEITLDFEGLKNKTSIEKPLE